MPMLVLLLAASALAGFTPPTTGHLSVATTADLVLSEDDTVSGTAGMLVGLDGSRWDEEEAGPAADAAPAFEFTDDDLAYLEEEVVADIDGVNVEVVARGDDPFARSGFTIGFAAASFVAVDTVFERLQADERISLALSLQRQAGQPHSPEGGGQQHILDGTIDTPTYATPPEIDHEVDVRVTFAGQVFDTDGALQERTVSWTDSGDASAIAAAQAYGRPWLLWSLLGVVVVLLALRLAQQGHRRTRERHGEIPPRDSEVDGFQPVHR